MTDVLDIPVIRVRLADPSGYVVQINSDQGDQGWLVRIAVDGTVTFGDAYTPDDAARTFWTFMASTMRTWWLDQTPEGAVVAAAKALPLDELDIAVAAGIGETDLPTEPLLAALATLRSALRRSA